MKRVDFDRPVDRRGSGSFKWDSIDEADVNPLWVADMDFRAAEPIVEALAKRVEHGIFGYEKVPEKYYAALTSWFERRHGWRIDASDVICVPGVVPAVSAIIKALTRPGDGVLLQTPAYNCFFSSIRNNGCRLVENPLKRVDTADGFSYRIDFEDLELKAADPRCKVMILCNPHNPTGRVWTRSELERVADVCRRNRVTVLSDEIHCELTLPGIEYVPYAMVDPDAIVCCSPSKAFNTAGLQIANIVAPDPLVRATIDRAVNDNEVCDVNPFGVDGLIAAYDHSGYWLDELREYISGNYSMLREFFMRELPGIPVCDLEATYLAWVDIRILGISSEDFEREAIRQAKVWVNAGEMYGLDGYIRINMATRRALLEEGLVRLRDFVRTKF